MENRNKVDEEGGIHNFVEKCLSDATINEMLERENVKSLASTIKSDKNDDTDSDDDSDFPDLDEADDLKQPKFISESPLPGKKFISIENVDKHLNVSFGNVMDSVVVQNGKNNEMTITAIQKPLDNSKVVSRNTEIHFVDPVRSIKEQEPISTQLVDTELLKKKDIDTVTEISKSSIDDVKCVEDNGLQETLKNVEEVKLDNTNSNSEQEVNSDRNISVFNNLTDKSGGECKAGDKTISDTQDSAPKDDVINIKENDDLHSDTLHNQEIVTEKEDQQSKSLPFKETEIVIPNDEETNHCSEVKAINEPENIDSLNQINKVDCSTSAAEKILLSEVTKDEKELSSKSDKQSDLTQQNLSKAQNLLNENVSCVSERENEQENQNLATLTVKDVPVESSIDNALEKNLLELGSRRFFSKALSILDSTGTSLTVNVAKF
jgi:hypothetical protein